jgi:hypothetical protein
MFSQLFSLDAQVAGQERHTYAEFDGTGMTVFCDGQPQVARSGTDAIRVARDYIGEFLRHADRPGFGAWGLHVTVSDGTAVYGEWPLAGRGSGDPNFQRTPLVRIRNRWHDSGPISALQNAVDILREYVPHGSSARRAA